jgi:hypothetical protein
VKNANFFAENWEKSQKNVIITSTPDPIPKWRALSLYVGAEKTFLFKPQDYRVKKMSL